MEILEVHVGGDVLRGEAIREPSVGDPESWAAEGPGRLSVAGDVITISAMEAGYSAFFRRDLTADVLISFRARLLSPEGASNINIITHCRPRNTGFPISPTGAYGDYHGIPNYIVTFVRDEARLSRANAGRTRLRRDPGFVLVQEARPDIEMGREYEVVFACKKGRIRYYLDGATLHDWEDPDPLPGGLFALRTYKTMLEYRSLLIARLL